jgi:predicted small secreted protein
MKKIILIALLLVSGVAFLSSCGPSKKGTGCPMIAQ